MSQENTKADSYTLDNAQVQLDNGYWKLLSQNHANHTGPLYSGPVKTLQYSSKTKSFKSKFQDFKYWGLNFLDYQKEDIKHMNLTIESKLLQDCLKTSDSSSPREFTFIVHKSKIQVPFVGQAQFSDATFDLIKGTYYYTYISGVSLSK